MTRKERKRLAIFSLSGALGTANADYPQSNKSAKDKTAHEKVFRGLKDVICLPGNKAPTIIFADAIKHIPPYLAIHPETLKDGNMRLSLGALAHKYKTLKLYSPLMPDYIREEAIMNPSYTPARLGLNRAQFEESKKRVFYGQLLAGIIAFYQETARAKSPGKVGLTIGKIEPSDIYKWVSYSTSNPTFCQEAQQTWEDAQRSITAFLNPS